MAAIVFVWEELQKASNSCRNVKIVIGPEWMAETGTTNSALKI